MKTYPSRSPEKILFYNTLYNIEYVDPLNFIEFDLLKAKSELIESVGWREYSGKHHESIWTRFYQGYILPVKFNIDKRKAHLSNLIFSEKLSKDEALTILENPIYDPEIMAQDYEYILKKLEYSEIDFVKYLSSNRSEHNTYKYDSGFKKRYKYFYKVAKLFYS